MYRPVKGFLASMAGKVMASEDPEVVAAIDAGSGKTLWEHVYPAPLLPQMGMEYGPGPHSTPLVVGDLVYAVGVTGKLHALDKKTGRVVWAHGGFAPSPSSPILIQVDGQEQLVFFHADGVAGLDPKAGATYWNHAHSTSYGLNISTPVWGEGNLLFLSSAYNGGSRVLELRQAAGQTAVKELWYTNRMRLHIGNAMRLGDLVLGASGDFGPAIFTAVNVRTGQAAWQERGLSRASSVHADGKLILLDEDGVLALARPDAQGLHIQSKAQVLSNRSWTIPTLVGTKLYLRDRVNIKALELS